MAEHPQASFTEEVLEEINEDCYTVDQEFWPKITAMQAPQVGGSPESRDTPPGPPQAPRPRLPQKLFKILGSYAVALFDCHFRRYPETEKLTWGSALVNLTFQTVVNKIAWLEAETLSASLTHHASLGRMHGAIRKALVAHFQFLARSVVAPVSGATRADTPPAATLGQPATMAKGGNDVVPGQMAVAAPLAKQARAATVAQQTRVAAVARLIKELDHLRPQQLFDDESEYAHLLAQYPGFLTFKVADGRPDLKMKVLAIQGSARHIRLAQELAAAQHGVSLATIQDDWKDYKPPEFRRQ
jgi:hypothetical protein